MPLLVKCTSARHTTQNREPYDLHVAACYRLALTLMPYHSQSPHCHVSVRMVSCWQQCIVERNKSWEYHALPCKSWPLFKPWQCCLNTIPHCRYPLSCQLAAPLCMYRQMCNTQSTWHATWYWYLKCRSGMTSRPGCLLHAKLRPSTQKVIASHRAQERLFRNC